MKADMPRAPIVKYGMSTDETERLVQRHVAVVDGLQLVEGGVLDHNLRVAAIVHAKLHGAAVCEQLPCDPPVLPVTVEPVYAAPQDLRSLLGLS